MASIEWAVPAFPVEDTDPDNSADAEHATIIASPLLTPYEIGNVPTPLPAPKHFITGAVYTASGDLVTASQRVGGLSGDQYVPADLPSIPPRRLASSLERFGRGRDRSGSTTLDGLWAYGGHWMDHFGHFITETLTAIPVESVDDGDVKGIVAHSSLPTRPSSSYAWRDRLAELAGLPQRRHVVTTGDCFPERLMISRRRLVLNAFARPRATALWDRIRDTAAPDAEPTDRVFLSRRRFEDSLAPAGVSTRNHRASLAWDAEQLEASFERAGFRIVHPETLSIDDQIRTVANAAVIAGGSGTALHLAAFATSHTRVIELGDLRSGVKALANQRVVCAARGQEMAFIPADRSAEESQDDRLDRVFAELL
ncbi:glycosyltransferase family 61 protein [Labedella populi]|uniref:Glycosyltransferase family 61 protein n=1 Tax=Labedella populi TaxID=2498850 RepID=A0A444QEH0_9MICO|nr:glycosyltransferase 61 family protein [Labedella populi]RWZ67949.1 glycosyltransferase family 61 protein [Labedella populi]